MRRFVGLAVLLLCSAPFGMSVIGCGHKAVPVEYCNSGDSGPTVGQVASIVLSPGLATTGESLNYGQIGQALSASAVDCKGNAVTISRITYASTSSFSENTTPGTIFADINPSSGQVCAGTWNRNVGGGIGDYTMCTAPTSPTNFVPAVVTPGGSPYTYTATAAGTLTVGGGNVSSIVLTLSGGQPKTQPYNSGLFNLAIGDAVTITYSSAPTVEFFAPNALSSVNVGAVSTFIYTAPSAGTVSVPASGIAFVSITHNGIAALQATASSSFAVSAGDTLTIAYYATPTVSFATPGGTPVPITVTPSSEVAFTYTSASGGTFALGGGTTQSLFLTHNGVSTLQSSTSGLFALSAGDSVAMLFTAAPTVGFNPYGAVAYVTATANGAVSNAIPVYVHPTATGIVLGGASVSCVAGQSGGTDCCPNVTTGTVAAPPVYNGTGCLSQNTTGQLVARVYANGSTTANNDITCQVGHLAYGTLNASNVVTIDDTGIATANQPGSTVITATIAQSSTSTNAGFFSTCPPTKIALTVASTGATSAIVPINNTQTLTATVFDQNNVSLTGISLEFNSTEPQSIPGSGGSITPIYPGTAQITAVCQPGSCNPSGFSQIGIYGNGKPITSNPVSITATGQSSTVLYAASLVTATNPGSQYLYTKDFTVTGSGSLIKLPYVPNSMVITPNGQSIYIGSSGGLMSVTTITNAVSAPNQNISGQVLAVSQDGTTLVTTDPVRGTVSLYSSTGTLETAYGGVGTHAQWSPDTQTVYITLTTGEILSYGEFTSWQVATSPVYNDVAITVPSVGAYFAGPNAADGRSYCSTTTNVTPGNPPTAVNTFLPLADSDTSAIMDRITATNDGLHMLGAHVPVSGTPTFTDMDVALPVQACPAVIPTSGYFTSTAYSKPLTVAATSITGVVPASNSAVAFVTYNGTSGLLPYYVVPAQGLGSLQYLTLSSGTSPLSGAFSIDNSMFFVGTATDNLIHEILVTYPAGGTPTAVDSGTLAPALPSATGTGTAPANLVVQYPKKAKS